jgi:hypothetical protein
MTTKDHLVDMGGRGRLVNLNLANLHLDIEVKNYDTVSGYRILRPGVTWIASSLLQLFVQTGAGQTTIVADKPVMGYTGHCIQLLRLSSSEWFNNLETYMLEPITLKKATFRVIIPLRHISSLASTNGWTNLQSLRLNLGWLNPSKIFDFGTKKAAAKAEMKTLLINYPTLETIPPVQSHTFIPAVGLVNVVSFVPKGSASHTCTLHAQFPIKTVCYFFAEDENQGFSMNPNPRSEVVSHIASSSTAGTPKISSESALGLSNLYSEFRLTWYGGGNALDASNSFLSYERWVNTYRIYSACVYGRGGEVLLELRFSEPTEINSKLVIVGFDN